MTEPTIVGTGDARPDPNNPDNYQLSLDFVKTLDKLSTETEKIFETGNYLNLDLGEKIRNFLVAESLDRIAYILLSKKSKISIKIDAQNHSLKIGMLDSKDSKVEVTEIHANFKPDQNTQEKKAKTLSYMFIETLMDFWLRYGATVFYAEIKGDEFTMTIEIETNKVKGYFEDNVYVGWNVHGDFFRHDWVKLSQRDRIFGGGKIDLR